jgi:hypothetical protein
MADYDFRSLSGYDFALLARDLVQADLGVRLESFSQGPDSGIDFRYRRSRKDVIVQCKHYADSGFAALASVLRRKERQKVDTLKPTRYLLATSVPLTPNRKDEIKEILGPRCLKLSDIYGREDLNNLLGEHSEIERRHFKLWLTSEAVLRRMLDSGIVADSEAHLDRVRLRLLRYVYNPSFDRARDLLDKSHYCIIAGIPGIGKTTLAEVLLADLVDRQGFEAFRIAHDLSEIRPVKNSKRKQVFYFDDFLGKTALEKLQKNEDQRLIELMEEVAANDNWRFILTTREYILNGARLHYEAFAHPTIDFTPCVVNLADYTRPIRGRILYNHLYFSDLPKEHKLALLQDRGYESILAHRNYSPRVVEYMTQARHACEVAPSVYRSEFMNALDNPARIWDHAFRHQISEASRHLLIVLSTLPNTVLLKDLETAFWRFYRDRQVRFGFSTTSSDWDDALKQLDGNFVSTESIGGDIAASFHSPSVRDFVEGFLSSSEGDVVDLIRSAHFYEQFTSLWTGRGGRRYSGVDRYREDFLRGLREGLFGPSAEAVHVVDSKGETIALSHRSPSKESRARFAVRVADDLRSSAAERFLAAVIDELRTSWEDGRADKENLVDLVDALAKRGLRSGDAAFMAARTCLSMNFERIDDFRALARFIGKYPDVVNAVDLGTAKSKFLEFASDYSDGWDDDDPDWLREVASDLEFVGEKFELEITRYTAKLHERADEIEIERAEGYHDYDPDERDDWVPASYRDDVDDMFQSLRNDLES